MESFKFECTDAADETDSLPLWMKEAAAAEVNSLDTNPCMDTCSTYSSSNETLVTLGEDDEKQADVPKKLSVPLIDWNKMNDEKNRNNRLLSNQRRQITKDKQKNLKTRTRKITPSHVEISPLKQLSSLKKSSDWGITEVAEEEEE